MQQQERRYASLLLITSSQETAAQFARLLPAERFAPEYSVCTVLEAPYVLTESTYDVIVIDNFAMGPSGLEAASHAAENGVTNILLLAAEERYEAVSSYAEEHGFMALKSPVDPSLLKQSLGMMANISDRIHELETKAETLQAKMEEMRVVDRAKLILISRFKMSESDAHRFIEKNAMDRCVKRRTVAETIIRTYQN